MRSSPHTSLGLTVFRIGNYDVERHFDSVCATIDKAVKQSLNTIQPSPGGEGAPEGGG